MKNFGGIASQKNEKWSRVVIRKRLKTTVVTRRPLLSENTLFWHDKSKPLRSKSHKQT